MTTNETNDRLETVTLRLTQLNVIDILEAFDHVRKSSGCLFQSELSIVRRLRDVALSKNWLSVAGKAWVMELSQTPSHPGE